MTTTNLQKLENLIESQNGQPRFGAVETLLNEDGGEFVILCDVLNETQISHLERDLNGTREACNDYTLIVTSLDAIDGFIYLCNSLKIQCMSVDVVA